MTNKRFRGLLDKADCLELLAEMKDVNENCNVTMAECFVAGCVNALDMVDEHLIVADRDFVEIALSEVFNRFSICEPKR